MLFIFNASFDTFLQHSGHEALIEEFFSMRTSIISDNITCFHPVVHQLRGSVSLVSAT